MKHIGFMGGCSMSRLGSSSDMVKFIEYLNENTTNNDEKKLVERLYKKYVSLEDSDMMLLMIKRLQNQLAEDNENDFLKYLDGMKSCIGSAKMAYETWEMNNPLRIAVVDIPDFMDDRKRPLEEYDALKPDDLPFWLREN